ncbi:hypothetical protein Tco_0518208, partial [Tanacetum coccineum]
KKEVEDHHRISSISKNTKSVTLCNDSSNSRTSNVNAVCAECGKCVFNSNHDACVSRYLKDVNARTKKPKIVPISASKPKRKVNKSVATPHKKTVAPDTTIQKSKSYYKKLYENTNQDWKWWIAKRCPSGSNLSNVPSSSNSLTDYTTHPKLIYPVTFKASFLKDKRRQIIITLTLCPQDKNVVPTAEKTDSSQQGLEFLFSPLLEEYYNPHDRSC